MSKKFQGLNIKEVWNFRLSSAVPVIDRSSGTWVVYIYSKNNPDDEVAEPLASHDTGIEAVDGDQHDTAKIIPCFEWLYSVRDDYSLENIEELKPHVAKIEAANKALSELGAV